MATTDLYIDDPTFQRVRQRIQNTIEGGLGDITPDRLGSFLNDLDGAQRQALMEEFKDQLPAGFMDRANKAAYAQQQNMAEGDNAHLLDGFNQKLDDFASLDRDNEGALMKGARGLANIPLWMSQGLQTAGEAVHDLFEDDESKHLNQGTVDEQIQEGAGLLTGGLVKAGGGALAKIGKNIVKNPGKLNPFSQAGRQALGRNKMGTATVATGAGGGMYMGGGNPDGMQNVEVNPDGSVGVAPNAPTGTQVPNVFNQDADPSIDPGYDQGAPGQPVQGGFEGPLNAARSMGQLDPKNKTPGSFQEQGIQQALTAEASRRLKNQIQDAKVQDRRKSSAKHKADLLEDRYDSTGGRSAGDWAKLSPEEQAAAAKNYQANSYYNSADEAKKARRRSALDEMDKMGGSFVDSNDPENKNQMPGQVSREQFTKDTGLSQDGTGIMTNPDGSFSTLETGGAFDKAGGLDTARDVISSRQQQGPLRPTSPKIPDGKGGYSQKDPLLDLDNAALANSQRPRSGGVEGEYAKMTNLERQTEGGDKSYRDQFGEGPGLSKDTVRLSSDMADYGDAAFKNKDDALSYLNRGASMDDPAPSAPSAPEEDDGSMMDYLKYAPLVFAPSLIKRGLNRLNRYTPKYTGRPGTPFPRGGGQNPQQKLLESRPQPNQVKSLDNVAKSPAVQALPHRPAPPQLPNSRMTPVQVRTAQQGGPGVGAARDAEMRRQAALQRRQGYGPMDPDVVGFF